MSLNEAETRSQLINPAIQGRGWVYPLVREEVCAKKVIIDDDGQPQLVKTGKADYVLRVQVHRDTEPVAAAVLEAKAENFAPDHGLEQAKAYADCERLHVPVVFASNGHQFVAFHCKSGYTDPPKPISAFPTPAELRTLYETAVGFSLEDEAAKPLLVGYKPDAGEPRYYQDAAIRAVLEKIARDRRTGREPRALLSLATGAGKTFIACNLLRRLADAGQLKRALFVCDRTELRTQALAAMQRVFGNDAAVVEEEKGANKAKNARVHIATFQTLDIDKEDGAPGVPGASGTASFLTKHYPPDYFSHIIIDECHRSAWGKWSVVLTRNPAAVKIGLTATPRELKTTERGAEAQQDRQITANNLAYFGEPVYEYTMAQAMDDGYLAACEIVPADVNIDQDGLTIDQVMALHPKDARTGRPLSRAEIEQQYFAANSFEKKIVLPDRVARMCADFFQQLLDRDGDPHQKTIIFCASDDHAGVVATEIGNLYAEWCEHNGSNPKPHYAFRCTASVGGNDQLPDFRGSPGSFFIATTVDLLTTGVDVPSCRNIVFFRYLASPISFYQMIGRGTRIDLPTGKLLFRVYDYTNARRLFGEEFKTPPARPGKRGPKPPPKPIIQVDGIEVRIISGNELIIANVDGNATPITVSEYKLRIANSLLREAHNIAQFRGLWCDKSDRHGLLYHLPGGHAAALVMRELEFTDQHDLYDVLAALAYETAPHTRYMRTGLFNARNLDWLGVMPAKTRDVVSGLANQFALGGTDALESGDVFNTPLIVKAGGMASLKLFGDPKALVRETKERIFAV